MKKRNIFAILTAAVMSIFAFKVVRHTKNKRNIGK